MSKKIEAKVTHRFKASAERVYDAWLDPEKTRRWMKSALIELGLEGDMKRVEIDARVGGSFFFSDMRDGVEAKHWGTYLELNRPRKIVFTWITPEKEEDDLSKVTLTLRPDNDGCVVTIVHELHEKWADYKARVENGWTQMLKAVGELLSTLT